MIVFSALWESYRKFQISRQFGFFWYQIEVYIDRSGKCRLTLFFVFGLLSFLNCWPNIGFFVSFSFKNKTIYVYLHVFSPCVISRFFTNKQEVFGFDAVLNTGIVRVESDLRIKHTIYKRSPKTNIWRHFNLRKTIECTEEYTKSLFF